MRISIPVMPAVVVFAAMLATQACSDALVENQPPPYGAEYPVRGVIRGSVAYSGPRPCSRDGHIVGNAIVLLFDRRNPPPPSGVATTAVNFVAVPGDTLFAREPRVHGSSPVCPRDGGDTTIISASAPFAIAPVDPGSYVIEAFFDYSGDFLPTFSFRRLPVAGDVAGGYIDLQNAESLENDPTSAGEALADGGVVYPQIPRSQDVNYQPVFLPIDVGIPGPVPPDSKRGVPDFVLPPDGFVADNVVVSIGSVLPIGRPYFYPSAPIAASAGAGAPAPDPRYGLGAGETAPALNPSVTATPGNVNRDPAYQPLVTFTQDLQVLAVAPTDLLTKAELRKKGSAHVAIDQFQASFPAIQLNFGLPQPELPVAVDPAAPFHLQITPPGGADSGLLVWWTGRYIPESAQVYELSPLIVLEKLDDDGDDDHTSDPQSLRAQGSDGKKPIVVIQAITLDQDSLFESSLAPKVLSGKSDPPRVPGPTTIRDHLTALVRPAVVCIDPRHVDRGGTLVTPHTTGAYPAIIDDGASDHPLFDLDAVEASQPMLIARFVPGCLPTGRYGINAVYPTGQAWTVPNEMGSCSTKEGSSVTSTNPGTCKTQPRPVLLSQGNRGVIEIVPSQDPSFCAASPVPMDCVALTGD